MNVNQELTDVICKHLKALRQAANMTQEELAKKIGVSRQTILGIEKGTLIPSITIILAIAMIFLFMTSPIVRTLLGAFGLKELIQKTYNAEKQEEEFE